MIGSETWRGGGLEGALFTETTLKHVALRGTSEQGVCMDIMALILSGVLGKIQNVLQ